MNAVTLVYIQTNSKHHFTSYLHCPNKELHWIIYRNCTNPLILQWPTKRPNPPLIISVHTVILHFEQSLLIAPIYHALVVSQSSLGVYKTNYFFFPDINKLEDAVHEHTKLSLTVKGTQYTAPRTELLWDTSLKYLQCGCQFLGHAGETQLCRFVMSQCNFLTHTPRNRRAGDNGVESHRKLRGRGDVMLGVTGVILQRG